MGNLAYAVKRLQVDKSLFSYKWNNVFSITLLFGAFLPGLG